MGVTEVTIAQFRAFVKATDYVTDGQKEGYGWLRRGAQDWECEDNLDWRRATSDESDDQPAVLISWYDAMAFCRWLSVESGQEIRLPSEAEWEHACRAGTTGLYAGEISAMGWSQHNSWGTPHPVAQKQPNAWGLYDMHGNVWEWCLDFFTTSYDGAPADGRPRWNVDGPTDVVSRGGSFGNPPGWLASGCRMGTSPSASHYNNGFRLVRVIKDAKDLKVAKTANCGTWRSWQSWADVCLRGSLQHSLGMASMVGKACATRFRGAMHRLCHCERSEAISHDRRRDCFVAALLAMTWLRPAGCFLPRWH